MSDTWLSKTITDFIALGNALDDEAGIRVYADLLMAKIKTQVSTAQTDVVILFEQVSGSEGMAINSNRSYRYNVVFNVHVFATRIQNLAHNMEAVAGTTERLIAKLVKYTNPEDKIANCAISVPPVMLNISGVEDTPIGSAYMQFQFGFVKTVKYL